MQYEVKNRQSLLDVAMITCGSVEAVVALARRNNVPVTGELIPGTLLEYMPEDIVNKQIVSEIAAHEVQPATAII